MPTLIGSTIVRRQGAVLPLLAAKQRVTSAHDWMTTDAEVACPDPHCPSRLRIVRTGVRTFRRQDTSVVPLTPPTRNSGLSTAIPSAPRSVPAPSPSPNAAPRIQAVASPRAAQMAVESPTTPMVQSAAPSPLFTEADPEEDRHVERVSLSSCKGVDVGPCSFDYLRADWG